MASHFRHRTFGPFGAIFALMSIVTLAACGGTPVPPTANDFATVAAARTATANGVPATGNGGRFRHRRDDGSAGASRGAASEPAHPGGAGRDRPVRGTAVAGGASTRGGNGERGRHRAGNALNACGLVAITELNRAMGETVRQTTVESEKPITTAPELTGYSTAGCAFAATASMQNNRRGVIIETIRPTPVRAATTMTTLSFGDLWSTIAQEAQQDGIDARTVNGLGDEAIAFDDPDGSGDARVYVRKGDILLHVTVVGYAADGRNKAIEVAKQAATKL